MSNRIDLVLRPSPAVGLIATIPWMIMASFAVLAGLTSDSRLLVFLVPISMGALRHYRRYGHLSGRGAVRQLTLSSAGLTARLTNGHEVPVSVEPSSRLLSWLALLKLRESNTTHTYAVLIANRGRRCSNTCDNEFRKLRAWLRLGRAGGSATTH